MDYLAMFDELSSDHNMDLEVRGGKIRLIVYMNDGQKPKEYHNADLRGAISEAYFDLT